MTNYKNEKIGAGITILSALILTGNGFVLLSKLLLLITKNSFIPGVEPITTSDIISSLLLLLVIVSVILILYKKILGVYGYFIFTILGICHLFVKNGFDEITIISIIFLILMGFFIFQKKEIYSLNCKNDTPISDYKDSKVGAKITIVSALVLAFNGYIILFCLMGFLIVGIDPLKDFLVIAPLLPLPLIIVSVILILYKNSLGVYGYFVCTIIAITHSVITQGFNKYNLILLIFLILMGLFIFQKKELYGLGYKSNTKNN